MSVRIMILENFPISGVNIKYYSPPVKAAPVIRKDCLLNSMQVQRPRISIRVSGFRRAYQDQASDPSLRKTKAFSTQYYISSIYQPALLARPIYLHPQVVYAPSH